MKNQNLINAIKKINDFVVSCGHNPLYLTLKVGDIVYTTHEGYIKQAKITEIESRFFYGGQSQTIHSDTQFKAILPTGETICREYNAKHNKGYHLYPSVEMVRLNKPFRMDIDAGLSDTDIIEDALIQDCGVNICSESGHFTFYKSEIKPTWVSYHYAIYSHNSLEIKFESKYPLCRPIGTIEELKQYGLYPTYDDAYKAFKPDVICFSDEEKTPAENLRVRFTIEVECDYDHEDDVVSELVSTAEYFKADIVSIN